MAWVVEEWGEGDVVRPSVVEVAVWRMNRRKYQSSSTRIIWSDITIMSSMVDVSPVHASTLERAQFLLMGTNVRALWDISVSIARLAVSVSRTLARTAALVTMLVERLNVCVRQDTRGRIVKRRTNAIPPHARMVVYVQKLKMASIARARKATRAKCAKRSINAVPTLVRMEVPVRNDWISLSAHVRSDSKE